MRIDLSSFLQLKFNVFIYRHLGWKTVFIYIIILGKLYFFFNRKESEKVKGAVKTIFADRKTESEFNTITKSVFRGIISHYFEKIFNTHENILGLKNFFDNNIEASSMYKLNNALRKGKGLLFVTGHYGGIEYIPIFLALNSYPISVIAKFATKELKNTLYSKTKDIGLKIIDAGQKNNILGSIIHELKANRIVFIECDEIEEWKPSQMERTFFLGKLIGVDRTINLIQRRTGAEIIFGILHRFNLQEYSLIMEDFQDMLLRFDKPPSSIGEAVLKTFEQYVYTYPEEWYQWKNYAEIKPLSTSNIRVEKIEPALLLEPVLGQIY
ncbi:MAG: hypothetical protein SV375_21115 [Thermodesulfobacteriota bacterium]|nr:hypothetical protein [Thermodesulfobacteriota bacterium]